MLRYLLPLAVCLLILFTPFAARADALHFAEAASTGVGARLGGAQATLLFPAPAPTLGEPGAALRLIEPGDVSSPASGVAYSGLMTALRADILLDPLTLTLTTAAPAAAPAMNTEPGSLILLGTAMMLTALLALKHAAHKDQFRHALTTLPEG